MKTVIVFGLVALTVSIARRTVKTLHNNTDEEWETFKIAHNKSYRDNDEESSRKNIFFENKLIIDEHNKLYKKGKVKYSMKTNYFGDWTLREYNERMNGYKSGLPGRHANRTFAKPKYSEIPTEVDWRFEGYVTEIKNQGRCNSDWAFSATGAIEGQNFRMTGKLVSLSEQQLLDCSNSNSGCDGGSTQKVFQYIISNNGVDTEETYPYTGQVGQCRFRPDFSVVHISDYVDVQPGDENLAAAIATIGPVSVTVYSNTDGFRFYHGGLYEQLGCSTASNHAMLAVGYGTHRGTGRPMWIVKNSWGDRWGEYGYMSMARDQPNICGISDQASYPVSEPPE